MKTNARSKSLAVVSALFVFIAILPGLQAQDSLSSFLTVRLNASLPQGNFKNEAPGLGVRNSVIFDVQYALLHGQVGLAVGYQGAIYGTDDDRAQELAGANGGSVDSWKHRAVLAGMIFRAPTAEQNGILDAITVRLLAGAASVEHPRILLEYADAQGKIRAARAQRATAWAWQGSLAADFRLGPRRQLVLGADLFSYDATFQLEVIRGIFTPETQVVSIRPLFINIGVGIQQQF